jgi:hypothetical protein
MSRVRRGLGLGAIVLLFLAYAGVVAVAVVAVGAASANLSLFLGSAHVERSGSSASTVAHSGDQLRAGDTVRTGEATKAAVGYPDGSISRLDSNSFLQVHNLASPKNGVWNVELLQFGGKSWHVVRALAGGASFQVDAPNSTTVQVRGTEFEVIVDSQAGTTSVRVDSWTGVVDVTAQGTKVQVSGGQSTSVQAGKAPSAAAPISAADRNDSFTVFNQALDATRGALVAVGGGSLSQGQTSTPLPAGIADGSTDLEITLGWPGSKFGLTAIGPDGTDFRTDSSDTPPVTMLIPKAAAGSWAYKVQAIESKPGEPYWAFVSWRVRPSWEAEAAGAYKQWAFDHRSLAAGAFGAPVPTSLDTGPLLKMDQSALQLVALFQQGDPARLIYASGAFTADPNDQEAYVAAPSGSSDTFLGIGNATAGSYTPAVHGKVMVLFTRSGPGAPWLASYLTIGLASLPAIAVGNDGYATMVAPSAQDHFLVNSSDLGGALAADVGLGLKGAGGTRFPSFTGPYVKSLVDAQQFYKQNFNWLEVDSYAAAPEYVTYSYLLADGSVLDFVTLTHQVTYTPPRGGCVLQPSPFYGGGYYSFIVGPPRGAYGSITQTELVSLAIVVPPKASGKTIQAIGSFGMVTAWTETPCSGRGTPGSGKGDFAYI